MLIKLSTLFLLAFLVLPSSCSTGAIQRARVFQTALNRAIGQQNGRSVSNLINNQFLHDRGTGPEGNKRSFVQQLLRERKQGVVLSATDRGSGIHSLLWYTVQYDNLRMECALSQQEPRMLMMCRDQR